ncbi:MAG: hypothetical protein ABEJ27_00785 [Halodesulfurarchaeum sp.]
MGLRCSLLGHDFGDSITEREREERGQEVVTTVREVRECRRCGTEQVVSENTEVRRVEREESAARSTGESVAGPAGEAEPEPEPGGVPGAERSQSDTAGGEGARPPGGEDPSSRDRPRESTEREVGDTGEAVDVSEFVEPAEGPSEESTESTGGSPVDPSDESVEMIDESGSETEGETPEETEKQDGAAHATEGTDTDEPAESEEEDGETEPEDDAIILTDELEGEVDRSADSSRRDVVDAGNMFDASAPREDDGESGDRRKTEREDTDARSRQGDAPDPGDDAWDGSLEGTSEESSGGSPEGSEEESGFQFRSEGTRPDRDVEGRDEADPSSGITSAGSIDTSGPPDDSLDVTFTCPECGYEVPAAGSSLRAGDICPECHGGYLTESG